MNANDTIDALRPNEKQRLDSVSTDQPRAKAKTPGKRLRRNYAVELTELQASVKIALKIIKSHENAKSDPVMAIVVHLLEGKE